MIFFHEVDQAEIDKLISDNKTWEYITKNYLQPKWCEYPEALNGLMGCWSLIDISKDGYRTKISEDYCKTCEYCKVQ